MDRLILQEPAAARAGRLRVAYIVNQFPAPTETFVRNQIAEVAGAGHWVDIYTTSPGPATEAETAPCGQWRTRCLAAPPGWRGVRRIGGLLAATRGDAPMAALRALVAAGHDGFEGSRRLLHAALLLGARGRPQYDVIHAQFGPLGLFALRLKQAGAISGALLTSFRGYDVGICLRHDEHVYDALFREGDLFLPVCDALRARLIRAGCAPGKVRVHRSGIVCRHLPYRERRAEAQTRIVTVGRLVEKKGTDYAVRAVARLLGAGCRLEYTIVGTGPLRDALARRIADLGVGRHVHLVGARSHAAALALMDGAHILLAPSVTADDGDEEGIPNVIKEAMALGVLVIGTRHGGIPEVIEDGVTGFLVPERDDEAIAERVAFLMEHPDVWTAMSRCARDRIEGEYDVERLNTELIGLYREVARHHGTVTDASGMGTMAGVG